ncbi:MAG: EAL domain-containing protein [Dechloromonas sp.]|nr:EAL domain-containing protein [Dechloromonas sp.]
MNPLPLHQPAPLRANLLLALAYGLAGWLALQTAIPPGYVAPLFPPAGIALAALLIGGRRLLPGVFAGAIGVQLLAAQQSGLAYPGPLILLLPALGATLQAAVGHWLARRLIGLPNALDSQEAIIRFVAVVAPAGCLVSASIALPALMIGGAIPADDAPFAWMNWWAGDTLGVLIMVPLLLVLFGRPADDWRPRRTAVAVPMAIALMLLAFTFVQVRDWENLRLQSQFDRHAEHVASLIRKRLDAQLDQVHALERLAAVHPRLTEEVWRSVTLPMMARYPGTQNFGWSPLVGDVQRPAFEAEQAARIPGFAILGRDPAGQTHVAGRKAAYLPIVFVEPLADNRSVVGLDPLVLEQTGTAARATRDSGQPVATESIRLVQESSEQRGVVVYQAVFAGEPRRQTGMISSVFRMDDTIRATLSADGLTQIGLSQIDLCLSDPRPGSTVQRLFGPDGCELPAWRDKRLAWRGDLDFAGRQWQLDIVSNPGYVNTLRSWGAWLTLVFGLFGTGILGAFLLLTSGRARQVEILVGERTRQLAAASQRLRRQQEELAQAQRIARLGSWENAANSPELHCSAELRAILKLAPEEAIDEERLLGCLHPDDRGDLARALVEAAGRPSRLALDCRLNDDPNHPGVLHFRIESDRSPLGALRIRGTAQDVTSARNAEAHIAYLAHYDPLTGLPNRVLWNERAHAELRSADRHGDTLAVLFLDLDHFKSVNDSLGHAVGDQLLASVAQRFTARLRDNDILARLGGDEFVILLPRLKHRDDALLVAHKLIDALAAPMQIGEHELTVSTSIGIALYPDDGQDVSTLLKHADVAMYSAKDQGRNGCQLFSPDMDARAVERLMLENALRRAIQRDELVLHYQPQVGSDGRTVGAEALVRWQHPEMGLLAPGQFIDIAEASGQIQALGDWVLRAACRQQVEWSAAGRPLIVAVNISALQFRQGGFTERVRAILDETGADPARLELELTESALMQPTPKVLARMNRLCDWGIRLALDDFGTGYSSLSYLKRLPIHRLKIDRAFVQDLPDDAEDVAITVATLSLAKNLGMEVVAEGVETAAQRDFLAERGCRVMQGYLFSRPLPVDDFSRWLAER